MQQGGAHLEGVGHAHTIRVAQEGIGHVGRTFQNRHLVEGIEEADRFRHRAQTGGRAEVAVLKGEGQQYVMVMPCTWFQYVLLLVTWPCRPSAGPT